MRGGKGGIFLMVATRTSTSDTAYNTTDNNLFYWLVYVSENQISITISYKRPRKDKTVASYPEFEFLLAYGQLFSYHPYLSNFIGGKSL